MKRIILLLFSLFLLAGCGSDSAEPVTSFEPPIFQCTVAYRRSVTTPIEDEFTFAVARFEERDFDFKNMQLKAIYASESGSSDVSFSLVTTATDIDSVLARDLYQLKTGVVPADQFAGDHGFSGLQYVYHPIGGDELQYFCKAVAR